MVMLRRREMFGLDGEPIDAPLYPSWKGSYSSSGIAITINGSTIETSRTGSSQNVYFNGSKAQTSNPSGAWFTIPAGVPWKFRIVNVSYNSRLTYSGNYVTISPYKTDGNPLFSQRAGNTTMGVGEGTLPDVEIERTEEEDVAIRSIRMYHYRALDLKCDIEIWVDGVWYAI